MTEVVAALIWDKDQFLICQRPAHKARGLLWEFVGGKVEQGESKEQALVRECREELAVTISVGDIFMEVTHQYPDLSVHLTLFHTKITEGVPRKIEHHDIRWITAGEIPEYEFCPADEEILSAIQALNQPAGGITKPDKSVALKIKRYDKLVRDNIPQIIEAGGGSCVTEILGRDAYLKMLDAKLDEELAEYHKEQNIGELADLLEVIYACAAARGHSAEELERIRMEKAAKRGGFEKRILLKEVTER